MKPLPFQLEDGAFLLGGPHRALWSEPGTGKTLAAAVALSKVECSLIVAPASATGQWEAVLRGQGLDAAVLPREAVIPVRLPQHGIMSWGLFRRGLADHYYCDRRPEVFVPDEAHKMVRDSAQRTAAGLAMIKRARRTWPLTGTPMIRYADDLWPLCNALWPDHLDRLGVNTRSAFLRRFCSMRDGYVTGTRQFTLRTLHSMLFGEMEMPQVVVRRTLAEVAPLLPPVTTRILEIPLTKSESLKLNKNLTADQIARLEQAEGLVDEDDAHIAAARRAMGMLKAPEAVELIREAPAKVIVVYWHREVGDVLERLLNLGMFCSRIDGSTSQAERYAFVADFNHEVGPKVLLLQMQAGGEAINPHKHCSHLIFVERDWSGAMMEQALRRVRRIGQTRHQQIDFLDCDHPLEAALRRTADRKMRDLGVLQYG